MGYLETWKILEEIIIELRKKGQPIPEHVMSDLKSAKTFIKLMDTGEGKGEISLKIEQYLTNVEANLVTEAQKAFPPERIDDWLRQLQDSNCDVCSSSARTSKKVETRFVPGLPRDQKWVRVTPITSLPLGKLEQLAKELGLSVKLEEDNHLIVHGSAEEIRSFVKRMTEQTSRESA